MATNRPKAGNVETRHTELVTEGRKLRGMVPYGVESRDMGGWRETIDRGALDQANLDELIARVDHAGVPIGRFPTTLDLEDRSDGLHWTVTRPESRADLLEAVERGDLRAGSWQMIVGRDRWDGDTRHVEQIAELRDVSIVSSPAYPAATVEYRAAPATTETTPADGREKESDMSEVEKTPEADASEGKVEERKAPDAKVVAEPEPVLKVEDRTGPSAPVSAYEAFRAKGFPNEQATIEWGEFRGATFGGSVSTLSPVEGVSAPLGYDQRWAYPVFQQVAVGADVSSVNVFQQLSRTIPAGTAVVRTLAGTTFKPEVSTGGTITNVPLSQVAAVETNIPNLYLEQDNFESIVEVDLRLAIDGGLDQLVKTAIDASGFQAPGSDVFPTSVRKAMTTIQGNGYTPDTLLLTPTASENLDTLVTGLTGGTAHYVYGAGIPAGQLFGLQTRVSKVIAAPAVVDSRAFGKLYISPVTLARFEVDAGATNRSNVRLEGNAAFGVERQAAAVRIASS